MSGSKLVKIENEDIVLYAYNSDSYSGAEDIENESNLAIENVEFAGFDKISAFNHILYEDNFIQEILEQNPTMCYITDESELWHFGVDETVLRAKLLSKYKYLLRDANIKIWRLLEEIEKNTYR